LVVATPVSQNVLDQLGFQPTDGYLQLPHGAHLLPTRLLTAELQPSEDVPTDMSLVALAKVPSATASRAAERPLDEGLAWYSATSYANRPASRAPVESTFELVPATLAEMVEAGSFRLGRPDMAAFEEGDSRSIGSFVKHEWHKVEHGAEHIVKHVVHTIEDTVTGTTTVDYHEGDRFTVNFENLTLKDSGDINKSITLDGFAMIDLGIMMHAHTKYYQLRDVQFGGHLTGSSEIKLAGQASGSKKLHSWKFKPITVMLGPIPVVLTPKLTMSLVVHDDTNFNDFEVDAMLSQSASWSMDHHHNVKHSHETYSQFDVKAPEVNIDVDVFHFKFELLAYGTAGFDLQAGVLRIRDHLADGKNSISGEIPVKGGIDLDAFGIAHWEDDFDLFTLHLGSEHFRVK
jgi:phage baseplate assembly protein gpV